MGQETKMASRIRINFHSDSEAMINKQINMELYASYVYMAMACYFDRDDVALKGFAKRFADNSTEEREHAQKLISYQNMRGGRVVFQDIQKPIAQEWNSALHAIESQLELEQTVHKALWNFIRSLIPMVMLSFAISSKVNTCKNKLRPR